MLRVRLARPLEFQLRAAHLDPLQLAKDFGEWKSGHPDDHYLFGHDSAGITSPYLRHAHMVPLTVPQDLERCNLDWERGHGRRTSDRYILYADGGPKEGYLLIALIDDPGAHALWRPAMERRRRALERVAEDFCIFGRLPL